ncbi:putative reverse transcriptase domain-containing protein [Tanacetum coccineum]
MRAFEVTFSLLRCHIVLESFSHAINWDLPFDFTQGFGGLTLGFYKKKWAGCIWAWKIKKESMKKAYQTAAGLGGKLQKTSSAFGRALEDFYFVVFVPDRNIGESYVYQLAPEHRGNPCCLSTDFMVNNTQPVWTCYDCGEQGHTRNRCLKKIKQEEVGEVHGRAYASKMRDSRSFVNTRFSSLLDIKPIKIEDSYKVELADGRIVSTNIVLKGCTLSLVNHIFEIDLMPIELGTFDVIIGMDCLSMHDAS